MLVFIQCIVALVALKAITVGSDFSLYLWIRYRGRYVDWYIHRDSNSDFSNLMRKKLQNQLAIRNNNCII